MEKVTISRHQDGDAGEYRAHVEGSEHFGRLTWYASGNKRVAEHTIVPEQIGGRGIAGQLVDALIEDARAQGFKVKPVCSYVVTAFEKHPEWADLRA